MLLFLLALPGAGAEWCDSLIQMIAAQSLPAQPVIVNGDLKGAIEQHVAVSPERDAIIVSHRPSAALCKRIAEADYPFVIVLRDPRDCVAELMQGRNHTFEQAMRAVTSGCAALTPLFDEFRAFIVRYEQLFDGGVTAVQQMAQVFGVTLGDESAKEVITHLNADNGDDHAAQGTPRSGADGAAVGVRRNLSDEQQRIADGALAAYASLFSGGEFGEVRWDRELFFLGDTPTQRAVNPIDVTGRMRCLIYGPYLYLQPGQWSVTFALAIAEDATPEVFLCEACTTETLGHAVLDPDGAGVYNVELVFDVSTAETPIELRVFNKRASFEGHILFGGAVLSRRGDVATVPSVH